MKLLSIKINGIKNICNPVEISFSNLGVDKLKLLSIKGIFGYNGAGKTALMIGVLLYKRIITERNFLIDSTTKEFLNKIINFQNKEFDVTCIFKNEVSNSIIKHKLVVSYGKEFDSYRIKKEEIYVLKGRTLKEDWQLVEQKQKNKTENSLYFMNETISIVHAHLMSAKLIKYSYDPVLDCYYFAKSLSVFLDNEDVSNLFVPETNILENHIYELGSKEKRNYQNSLSQSLRSGSPKIHAKQKDELIKLNLKLVRFVQIFKPSLSKIELSFKEESSTLHVSRTFVYKNGVKVDFDFESTGIKRLVKLFSYLFECSNGQIVFIDEIDTNINPVYFGKLVEYFKEYGQGQLCFTSQNILTMDVLRNTPKSISVLGDTCLDTWVANGNRSPIKDYQNGNFVHSPMNLEDFDFLPIFKGNDR